MEVFIKNFIAEGDFIKILIDADACPVTDIAISVAKRRGIECILVCDTSHLIEIPGTKTVIVSKGADSADFALLKLIEKGDIAITQDYGLAAMCLALKCHVLNQNGLIYTNENILSLLEMRNNARKARQSGRKVKGPAKRSDGQDTRFYESLLKLIETAE